MALGRGNGKECTWGRKKAACCRLDAPAPPQSESYAYDWYAEFPDECAEEEDDAMGFNDKRSVLLDERGSRRDIRPLARLGALGLNSFYSRYYPPRRDFIDLILSSGATVNWLAVPKLCDQVQIARYTAKLSSQVPLSLDIEYPLDLQVIIRFIESYVTGILPGGRVSAYPSIPVKYFNIDFGLGRLPAGLPLVSPTSPDLTNPLARVLEAFGSDTNTAVLFLADRTMNQIKGKFIGLVQPMKEATLSKNIMAGAAGDALARIKWLSYVQNSIGTFNYLRDPEVNAVLVGIIANIRQQLSFAAQYTSAAGGANLVAKWDEYIAALIPTVQVFAQNYATSIGTLATGLLQDLSPNPNYAQDTQLIISYIAAVGSIGIPIKLRP